MRHTTVLLVTLGFVFGYLYRKRKEKKKIADNVLELIGNTPMVELKSLSKLTKCRVLAKLEYLNPGGSGKDRAALGILQAANLHEGDTVYEATTGSTGIALALLCNYMKLGCKIYMPNDQAKEKSVLLKSLGAEVTLIPPFSIVDKQMYVNVAQKEAEENGGFFANQFENEANFKVHYETTGPEIYAQCDGRIDAIVMGAGTAGTIGGISKYLKERRNVTCILVDPPGSCLFNKFKYNVMFDSQYAEGKRRRTQVDTVIEGVGLARNTHLVDLCDVDECIRVTDQEAVDMSRFLLKNEGLFLGSSGAMNCVGVVKAAKEIGEGKTIVTVLSDQGYRHLSKFWNDEFLLNNNLDPNKRTP